MRSLPRLFISILSLTLYVAGEHWAFLAAGSKGWTNYRHQADLCHAYHLLQQAGVPAKNIVTMFYDDVASSPNNIKSAGLINRPNGENVYEGVAKDYTGNDVTPVNLLNVLKGNKNAMKNIGSGRVIESGPEDTIFLNIIDHGSPGMISINNNYLYADQLNDALRSMRKAKSYKKMVIFVETCESGSMFDSIIDDDNNVFVMTAAAPDENSYVRYYDDDLETYIGDTFSTTWMEFVQKTLADEGRLQVSLFKLYNNVRSLVTNSHVMIYGDFRLGYDNLTTFFGNTAATEGKIINLKADNIGSLEFWQKTEAEKVSSEDVPLRILQKKLKSKLDSREKITIQKQIDSIEEGRDKIDTAVLEVLEVIAGNDHKLLSDLMYTKSRATIPIFSCYRQVISIFSKNCVDVDENPYATKHFNKFINICLKGINLTKVKGAFKSICEREDLKNSLTTRIY